MEKNELSKALKMAKAMKESSYREAKQELINSFNPLLKKKLMESLIKGKTDEFNIEEELLKEDIIYSENEKEAEEADQDLEDKDILKEDIQQDLQELISDEIKQQLNEDDELENPPKEESEVIPEEESEEESIVIDEDSSDSKDLQLSDISEEGIGVGESLEDVEEGKTDEKPNSDELMSQILLSLNQLLDKMNNKDQVEESHIEDVISYEDEDILQESLSESKSQNNTQLESTKTKNKMDKQKLISLLEAKRAFKKARQLKESENKVNVTIEERKKSLLEKINSNSIKSSKKEILIEEIKADRVASKKEVLLEKIKTMRATSRKQALIEKIKEKRVASKKQALIEKIKEKKAVNKRQALIEKINSKKEVNKRQALIEKIKEGSESNKVEASKTSLKESLEKLKVKKAKSQEKASTSTRKRIMEKRIKDLISNKVTQKEVKDTKKVVLKENKNNEFFDRLQELSNIKTK